MYLRQLSILLLLIAFISCAPANKASQSGPKESASEVNEIISTLPAENEEELQWANRQIKKSGPEGMRAMILMLTQPEAGIDAPVRYAIDGFTKFVSSGDQKEVRELYEQVLLEELQADKASSNKRFLMEQLELIGTDRAVTVLATFIGDEQLNEPAVHALQAIHSDRGEQVLIDRLPDVSERQKVALIQALGGFKTTDVQSLIPFAASANWQLRKVALYALANSGNSAAQSTLSIAADTSSSFRKAIAQDYYLLLSKRMAETGDVKESTEIYRDLFAGDYPVNVRSAALAGLVNNEGQQAQGELLSAVENSEPEIRAAALSLTGKFTNREVTEQWVDKLDNTEPEVQADIIEMLGNRSDPAALSKVTSFLAHDDMNVRVAAIGAVGSLGKASEMPELIRFINQPRHPEELEAARVALLQQSSEEALVAVSEALPSAPNSSKVMLIELLAERRANEHFSTVVEEKSNPDEAVRIAVFQAIEHLATPENMPQVLDLLADAGNPNEQQALQQAFIVLAQDTPDRAADIVSEAFNEAPDDQKSLLLEMLPDIGSEKGLQLLSEATKSSNMNISSTAVSGLANWPDATAIPNMQELLLNDSVPQKTSLLEGYLRLVTNSKYSSEDKVRFLSDMMPVVSSSEEKAMIISSHSSISSPASLRAVATYFSNQDDYLKEVAVRTTADMLKSGYSQATSFDEVDKIISVLESTSGNNISTQVERSIVDLRRQEQAPDEFISLFNEVDLSGWTGDTEAYKVENGQIINRDGESGNIFTEEQYADFVLRFDFKLTPGANSGLGIRSPLEGNPAYEGMELQILDDGAERYADLEPYQYHGSIYGVVPAKKWYLKEPGEWNSQEVIAQGSQITVILNGETIVDADIEEFGNPETIDGRDHPGLLRERGHIGFLGHGSEVAFRNIRIQDLHTYYPSYEATEENEEGMNQPPEGFKVLFNGENLDGWKGLVGDPESRREMSEKELAQAQQGADQMMHEHWEVRDGILYFDGKGESLATQKAYKDFEMLVDWKIEPGGDSGIYLRGTPQVQIWDVTEWPQGSGGLYNNQKNSSDPIMAADNPVGEWNTMRIKMIGDKVTVHLNGEKVVSEVEMENFWNREIPIYPEGQIELQSHNTPLYFRNIFIREIPRTETLIDDNLDRWQSIGGNSEAWNVEEGVLSLGDKNNAGGWLSTVDQYENFHLELEYKLPEGGNSGVFIRAPHEGNPAYEGIEVQLLNDDAAQYTDLEPWQYTGSLYNLQAPSEKATRGAGEWQKMEITANGHRVQVALNGELIINTSLVNFMDRVGDHPGLKRRSGHIGLQNHSTPVEFRNISITEIKD